MDRRKKTALRAFAIFFAVMAVCTVLSRAASSILVAQVEAKGPVSGSLTETFEGSGTAEPSRKDQIFLWSGQQVEKSVGEGGKVKKGDCIVQFRMEYLNETVEEKESQVQQLKLQLQQQQVAARGTEFVRASDSAQQTLERAQNQLAQAEQRALKARDALDAFEGEEADRQVLADELQAALDEKTAAEQSVQEAEAACEEAARQDAVQEANNAASIEAASLASDEIQVQLDQTQKELDKLKEYQEAEGRICAGEDCVILENNVADGTVTTGSEVIVTGSGEWKLKGTLDTEARKRLSSGAKMEVTFKDSGISKTVEAGSFAEVSEEENTSAGAQEGADGTVQDGSGTVYVWYAPAPEGTEVSYGTEFTWETKVDSERAYDSKIPLAALREDSKGSYCLIITEEESMLGTVKKAKRVDLTVLDKDEKEAAVEGVLEKADQVIVSSEKYVEEGDQVRIKS